jgi:hypothetical protein
MGVPAQRVRIPVFPLTNVVLFPGVQAPLHVFEPRYRALTADALAGERTIGMVAVRPEQAADLVGNPELYPFGCAGTIHSAEELPDGRYNIVLCGTKRFRIEREMPQPEGRLYRVAEVTLLDDVLDPADTTRLRAVRHEVVALFSELVRRTNPERSSEINDALFAGVDDTVFTNTFCQLLELEPVEKQSLLEAERVADRCEQLAALLRFRLVELSSQSPGGERSVH